MTSAAWTLLLVFAAGAILWVGAWLITEMPVR
jgi:hypothetical protein